MYQLNLFTSFLSLFAIFTGTSMAMTEEQKKDIYDHFHMAGMKCLTTNDISTESLRELKAGSIPDREDVPCFIACIMMNVGIMDDKGMLQKESTLDFAKKFFENEEEIKNIEEYIHSCSHVNSASVSDGEKGCERAMLAAKCMRENASKFGFDI